MAQRSAGADPGSAPADPVIHVRVTEQCLEAAALTVAGVQTARVPAEDFECEFDDGTPMSYSQLMRHVTTARIHAVVMSEGEVLHYGTGRRWFTKAQKAAIAYRDRYCGCGCGMLARYCDIDHQIEATDGGLTDIENGHPRCRRSHSMKTEQNKQRRRQQRTQQQEQRQHERLKRQQPPQQQHAQSPDVTDDPDPPAPQQQDQQQQERSRDATNDPDPPPL